MAEKIFAKIFTSFEDINWGCINQDFLGSLIDQNGMNIFLRAVAEGNQACLEVRINALGPRKFLASKDKKGRTASHLALIYRRLDLVHYLISQSYFSCTDRDHDGLNAFHWAIHQLEEHIIQELLCFVSLAESWVPPQYPNFHISPLALAAVSGRQDIIDLCLQYNHFKDVSLLEHVGPFGTIFHLVIHANVFNLLTYFISQYHDQVKDLLETKDFLGRTPLQLAAFLGDIRGIKILLDAGALINQGQGGLGASLFLAAQSQKPEAVAYLISQGADLNSNNKNGLTALGYLKDLHTCLTSDGKKCKNILENSQGANKVEQCGKFNFAQRAPFNLVLEGFSEDKSIYVAAVEVLEEKNCIAGLKRVTGQGMGSIISALIAVGYNSKDIKEQLPDLLSELLFSIEDFADDQAEKISTYSLSYFKEKLDSLLSVKTGISCVTFGQLAAKVRENSIQYKHLHIIAMIRNTGDLKSFNSEDGKNEDIVISSALASVFADSRYFLPTFLQKKDKEEQFFKAENTGPSVLNTHFTSLEDIFDDYHYQEDPYFKGKQTNHRTLAIHVPTNHRLKSTTATVWHSFIQDVDFRMKNKERILEIDLRAIQDKNLIKTECYTILNQYLSFESPFYTVQGQQLNP